MTRRRNGRINHFKARVEMALARQGLRVVDLARLLEIAPSTVRTIMERGHPREATLERFAIALQVTTEELCSPVTPERYGVDMLPRM
jgi:lambda repressor-like predicted transcriptional regulator